ATFIYSWDNLPKGRMAVHPDHFLVWSERMRQELLAYYPEVGLERVHVVGTPQFEPHFDRERIRSRDEFLRAAGLDPDRPVVCFSGDDEATSPYDPAYLADLARAVRELPEPRPQILFRRAPTDVSGRYSAVLAEHPEIAVCDPLWTATAGDWTGVAPMPGDLSLLANVAAHCSLVVNLASTMAMDFAIHGKPAVFLDYDPPGAAPWAADIYRLPHFRTVHELGPVHWARRVDQLADVIHGALAHPGEKQQARERWLREVAAHPLERASERCVAALLGLGRP
ncbi:MAG: UDP-glycosyltransferase, partial [Thermoanaerobaculia bacterium]